MGTRMRDNQDSSMQLARAMLPSPARGDNPMACLVFAQTWDPNTELEGLADAVLELSHNADKLNLDEYDSKLEGIQYRIAGVALTDRAAAAASEVALLDREELSSMAADIDQQTAEARDEISRLRICLAEERLANERRVQYNALAKVIRREQPRNASEQIIANERAAISELEAQAREIEKKKSFARTEFQLLLQCVADLEVYSCTDGMFPVNGAEDIGVTGQKAGGSGLVKPSTAKVDADMTDV